ncbi:cytoplasmic dynein 1 heavy chain 1-like isoform X1 [Vicugna pacos]|uniref:Cytoplasmic dynein 1 heavy chain 1-like isoform X1 n=1 Tax=Vicugna pacos TaxID=30538 RepID=A0ABM5CI91_VICPA
MSEPGGGGGEDGSAGLEVSAVQNVADVSVLQKHLRKLVPLLLEDGGEAPAALEAALEEKSALEQMRKFLSDPQVHTVLVERSTLKEVPSIFKLEERVFEQMAVANSTLQLGSGVQVLVNTTLGIP